MNFRVSARSLVQYRNILFSLVYRGGSLLASLLTVPLSLSFLSESAYGAWLVIYSVLNWTTFFDFGFGNGLKSKLSAAVSLEDAHRAKKLVSTHYIVLILIITLLIGVFSAVHPFVDWHAVLNVDRQQVHLKTLIWGCLVIFCIKLVLDSIHNILLAYQKVATVQLIGFLSSVFSLIAVFCLSRMQIASVWRLPLMGILMTAIPALLSLAFNIYFFFGDLKNVRPSIRQFHRSYIRELFSLGGQFFIIQIAALVIYSTDNVLVSKLFGPAHVAIYSIAYRLFSIFSIVWNLVITPYWVAFNEAYLKDDFDWIKKTVNLLFYLWLGMIGCLLLCLQVSDYLYRLWVGPQIKVSMDLSVSMALFVAIAAFSNIFAYFTNGVAKVRIQLIFSIIAAGINIPLAIVLSKTLGLKGIIVATCISLAISAAAVCLQYFKIINRRAVGVWNR